MISGQNEICLSHNPLHHPMNHSIELDSTYLLLSTKEEWRYDIKGYELITNFVTKDKH